ncbi:hypothetical protein F0P96_09025 [Hymenobacter busanensis]|uniref:Uncharacterized protein n=1 Tax=Hymenobacter busanensis TaxID=2607656 RepID=A0A7L4ZY65_9BACT|nr:hypothetical protein [Hymenobacter busanensis]KAA9333114.1 hypothetical protein F0P96_09025 [Hymenobacter busanensis]QHJ08211.1 hypothetical protein GUY19_13300 [Hymenobacter busanensis]
MDNQLEQQLEKIMPEDLTRTFESAYHVITGNNEHIEDLLHHGGTLLRKASQRMTTTQLVLSIAVLAIGTVFVLNRYSDEIGDAIDDLTDGGNDDKGAAKNKAPQANKDQK